MSKTFAQAPKPKPLTAKIITAFEQGGAGQDTQNHKTTNVEKKEPSRRLSIDLPETWHRRFKAACAKADKKMLDEVFGFIKQRTEDLEKQ